jgi:broad specificity phosphatase PhoE
VHYVPNEDHYILKQAFAIVRHADRLDHTDEWHSYPDRPKWPNDSPLTKDGHKHATSVGDVLKKSGTEFGLIVCSPYFRCAQTASRIAQVLKIPVHFDLDLGEVFDQVSMKGDIKDKIQHRAPKDLEKCLKPDFPDVNYVKGTDGEVKIEGKLQEYPEEFKLARMRFCYKTKKLVQKAVDELMSVVIVTHGDGVAAVVGLLRENWKIGNVPYTAYAHCKREVKVYDRTTDEVISDLPVYVTPEEWTIQLSPGFETKQIAPGKGPNAKEKEARRHEEHIKQMNAMGKTIQTSYTLDDHHLKKLKTAMSGLGAANTEHDEMLIAESRFLKADNEADRVHCSPHAKEDTPAPAAANQA